jgi:hypothetical protein
MCTLHHPLLLLLLLMLRLTLRLMLRLLLRLMLMLLLLLLRELLLYEHPLQGLCLPRTETTAQPPRMARAHGFISIPLPLEL